MRHDAPNPRPIGRPAIALRLPLTRYGCRARIATRDGTVAVMACRRAEAHGDEDDNG